jgi:hypothetical protein
VGRIPELNAYLLEFDDAAAADAARLQLGSGSDVAAVDYNYYYDQPEPCPRVARGVGVVAVFATQSRRAIRGASSSA